MLKSCKYCGGIHEEDYICSAKPETKTKEHTIAVDFRNTYKWKKKREKILQRDRYLCRECLYNHAITTKWLEVHHITPIVEDYDKRLDDDNLITLCSLHHSQAERNIISREHLREIIISPPAVTD